MNIASGEISSLKQEGVKRTPIMVSLIIGVFFAILNETLLNVAYINLMADFKVEASTVQWLSTGFLLVVGICIPVSALFIQSFTTRQLFLGSMVLFTIGTIVCGFAPTFFTLMIGRVIQAGGTGFLIPVMMNTILVLYPPEKRGSAMGTIGFVIMFAPAIGPTLSGFIVELFDWRMLFYIVIPFAIFSIAFASVYLKNVTEVTKPKVDIPSILLSTIGFGGVVFGFSSAGEGTGGWTHLEVYLSLIIGLVSLTVFVIRQLKMEEPLLDVRAFKSPMFTISVILTVIIVMTMFSTMIIIPMFLQGPLALTALAAGFVLLPGGILNGIMSPIAGRLYDKFGPRALVTIGALILVIVLWFFMNISDSTSIFTFIVLHSLLMLSVALMMTPVQTNGLNQLPPHLYPHGSAILNTLLQVGGAIGIALYISVMAAGQSSYLKGVADPEASYAKVEALNVGVQYAFTVALFFAVIALIVSLFLKRSYVPVGENS